MRHPLTIQSYIRILSIIANNTLIPVAFFFIVCNNRNCKALYRREITLLAGPTYDNPNSIIKIGDAFGFIIFWDSIEV